LAIFRATRTHATSCLQIDGGRAWVESERSSPKSSIGEHGPREPPGSANVRAPIRRQRICIGIVISALPKGALMRGPSTFRKQDVTRALRAAKAAGYAVASVQIDRSGNIIVTMKSGDCLSNISLDNEWDAALSAGEANQ
jgi:hypothetical protein